MTDVDRFRGSLAAAFRTGSRFDIRFALIGREREKLLALCAGTDLEIGSSIRIDVGRKKKFVRIVPDRNSVGKFDDGKTIIKNFERGFLSLSLEDVAHHKDRLTFPLGAEIAQRVVSCCGARKLAAGTCSCRWHRQPKVVVSDGNLYHSEKNDVKVGILGAKEYACLS